MNSQEPQRKIIHIDMDCFFAAIEIRENPSLSGLPIAVGGSPDKRGVVATCSYEARKFGIHSAMPTSTALRKCPALICLPVRMPLYKKVSKSIQSIFREYTELVEPLSLDEAFLDVTGSIHCQGSATLIAEEIRQRIYTAEKLTASAGIAPNKFLAKVCSDWHKPNGQKIITPREIDGFVKTLPVKKINGVGKVTEEKLSNLGIKTCGNLQMLSASFLENYFGRFGKRLYELSRGIDSRPVNPNRIRKSLSVETTFAVDLDLLESGIEALNKLYEKLLERLAEKSTHITLPIHSLTLKIRFSDFKTTTIQTVGNKPQLKKYQQLYTTVWERTERPVRLIGLGITFSELEQSGQLELELERDT
ncbi:MAG: DNA polymerase IV [Gammaproteobacteria bacterium]|nr:MAG: DNA polymerase IV [Gammaproteobacteria bacterium]